METIIKHVPPYTIIVSQPGLPDRHINLNKLQVQAKVEEGLREHFKTLGFPGKKMTKRESYEQAAYIKGAAAALQAVFGVEGAGGMTDFVPPYWITSIWRDDRIVSVEEVYEKGK